MRNRFVILTISIYALAVATIAQDGRSHSILASRHRHRISVLTVRSQAAEVAQESDLAAERQPAATVPPQIRWQWVLTLPGNHHYGDKAELYDLDMFPTPADDVATLHKLGKTVFCYIDGGSWEKDRPDAKRFPKEVLGRYYQGYPDERWLDIRRIDILGPIMTDRIKLCKKKGFDGAQFDNLDGFYIQPTGFPLTAQDQLRYNSFLAKETRKLGLAAALENDILQSSQMSQLFDWAIFELDRDDNHKCFYGRGCKRFGPFVQMQKAVMVVDYDGVGDFCTLANQSNFNGIRKHEDLGVWVKYCR